MHRKAAFLSNKNSAEEHSPFAARYLVERNLRSHHLAAHPDPRFQYVIENPSVLFACVSSLGFVNKGLLVCLFYYVVA